MRCITTKYLGPTNTKGTRVKASGYNSHTTVSWDYSRSTYHNHERAARTLALLNGWMDEHTVLLGGALPNSDGHAFLVPPDNH